jgi:hypothetical protein
VTRASNRNLFVRNLVEKLSLDSCVNVRPIITQDRRDFLSVGLINRKNGFCSRVIVKRTFGDNRGLSDGHIVLSKGSASTAG